MPSNPNKLTQIWQELKRRNVVRVVTVYAGAAFVIIELINNIYEPLRLPEWTPALVIVLLAIGFPIVIIFSWIYDVLPGGGIVKTEPAEKNKTEEIPRSANGWKIASYISFVVIVGLIVLNIIPRAGKNEILEKSIAILPFINDSPEQERMYFINGTMDAILDNLSKIKDLRVVSRTSVEQYRNNPKPIPVVAGEINVSYILEGSGHRDGDKVRLFVQLLDGKKDQHLWSNTYQGNIEDIFSMLSEIAQQVAGEIEAIITPEEQELIEKIPTTNITALDLYQRGKEEYYKSMPKYQYVPRSFLTDYIDYEALDGAEFYFTEALKYDSTFAQAYTGLVRVYWDREVIASENMLDTVRILLDKALAFDPGLAEAYTLYGRYYNSLRDDIRAMSEVDKAIALNPNDWEAYRLKANISSDNINRIMYRQKAVLLNHGLERSYLLSSLGGSYRDMGLFDQAVGIYEERLKLSGDSITYFGQMGAVEYYKGNFNRGVELMKKSLALDSTQLVMIMSLFQGSLFNGDKEQALKYGKIWVDEMNASGILWYNTLHRMGIYYELQGLEQEANLYYDLQIEWCLGQIEQGNLASHYDLASTYAVLGETEKAIESLIIWSKLPKVGLIIPFYLRNDSNFNSIRDNSEFQQIVSDVEAKYQAEHERVSQWLEENDML